MSKAIAKQEDLNQRAVAIAQEAEARAQQLAELGVEVQDLVIPSLMLMQNTSEYVGEGTQKLGDIINSQTRETLGSFDKPVKILPLKLFKTLRIYDLSEKTPKFLREEPITPANDKLPWEGEEDGMPVRRYHTINAFVLLKSDMDKSEAFPCLVRFKSTSLKAGRSLATHLYKRVQLRQLPYSQTVELLSKRDKKETNHFATFEIGKPEKATESEIKTAEEWLAMLKTARVKVEEEREVADDVGAAPVAKPAVVAGEVLPAADDVY